MSEPYSEMSDIDKITLKLFLNKNQYGRYLISQDSKKIKKNQLFYEKTKKYHQEIMDLLSQFINDPQSITSHSLNDVCVEFTRTCIAYIEHNKPCHFEEIVENNSDTLDNNDWDNESDESESLKIFR